MMGDLAFEETLHNRHGFDQAFTVGREGIEPSTEGL